MAARKTPQQKGYHGEFAPTTSKKPEHSCTCNKDESPTLTLAIEISQENEPAESPLPSFREDIIDSSNLALVWMKIAAIVSGMYFLWYATQYITGRI